jgi:Putative adhesin
MISRTTLIGALVVVELAIAIAAIGALTGSMPFAPPFRPLAMPHGGRMVAEAVGHPTFDRIFETGLAPHVVVDLRYGHVIVRTAPASSVRVLETLDVHGFVYGSEPPIVAENTADGVHVRQTGPGDGMSAIFGDVTHDIQITVPPTARVEVSNSNSIDAAGLRAKFTAHTSDGRIRVRDHRGDLDVTSDDGRIYLTDVEGSSITATTHSGRLYLDRVGGAQLVAHTDDGRIYASEVRAIDGALSTHSGNVSVGFASASDATTTIHATDDITVHDFPTVDNGEKTRTVRMGSGHGHFEVSSGDGSVSVSQGANV